MNKKFYRTLLVIFSCCFNITAFVFDSATTLILIPMLTSAYITYEILLGFNTGKSIPTILKAYRKILLIPSIILLVTFIGYFLITSTSPCFLNLTSNSTINVVVAGIMLFIGTYSSSSIVVSVSKKYASVMVNLTSHSLLKRFGIVFGILMIGMSVFSIIYLDRAICIYNSLFGCIVSIVLILLLAVVSVIADLKYSNKEIEV